MNLTDKQYNALRNWVFYNSRISWFEQDHWWLSASYCQTSKGVADALVKKGYLEARDNRRNPTHSNPSRVAKSGDIYRNVSRFEYRVMPDRLDELKLIFKQKGEL